jgi:hypothetical protein
LALVPTRGQIGENVRQSAYSEHLNRKQAMADFNARWLGFGLTK